VLGWDGMREIVLFETGQLLALVARIGESSQSRVNRHRNRSVRDEEREEKGMRWPAG